MTQYVIEGDLTFTARFTLQFDAPDESTVRELADAWLREHEDDYRANATPKIGTVRIESEE